MYCDIKHLFFVNTNYVNTYSKVMSSYLYRSLERNLYKDVYSLVVLMISIKWFQMVICWKKKLHMCVTQFLSVARVSKYYRVKELKT